ncbi:MAG: hypothetical protein ACRDG8_02640, partial [Actinomycetota bacterium]
VGGMSPLGEDRWVHAEGSVPEAALAGLARAGFRVEPCGPLDRAVGHAQLLVVGDGRLVAGSDPRADGGALAS